jgi:hypothetical protein
MIMSPPPGQRRLAAGLPNPRAALPDEEPTLQELIQTARQARLPNPGGWADLPFVGPAWETAYDLQEGDYAGAALNLGLLAAEFTPAAPLRRVAKIARAITRHPRAAPLLARDATQRARIRRFINNEGTHAERDYEIHHTIPFKKLGPIPAPDRSEVGLWRNHPANLKVMDKVTHHRLTGDYFDRDAGQVLRKFNAAQRAWHGTNALQKTSALAGGATAADWGENRLRASRKGGAGEKVAAARRVIQGSQPNFDPNRPIQVRKTEPGFIISNRKR